MFALREPLLMTPMSTTSLANQIGADFLGVTPLNEIKIPDRKVLENALPEWSTVVGKDHVLFDEATRADFSKTTLPRGTTPSGVIRPGSTDEVQKVVQIAHKYNIPLHAISRGKNWGYGDACASSDGQVIIDLRRMNQIREINIELGYAIIEPGVTQGQMYESLCENSIPLMLDVTGAGTDASIVGNILQRGFGHTRYGDRFRHTSGFEVILPDGRLIKTGFGQFDNAQATSVYPSGLGPSIDGLFTQSSLGIVTSTCIWLMPRPEIIAGFALKLKDDSQLGELVDKLRVLKMRGVVRSTVHVANDLRVISSRIDYPWDINNGEAAIPEKAREHLRREAGIGTWNLIGGMYGSKAEIKVQTQEIRSELSAIAPVRFFRRSTIERAKKVAQITRQTQFGIRLAGMVQSVSSAFDLIEGIPSNEHLKGTSWRSNRNESTTDIRDRGLIWHSPVIPMTCNHARQLIELAEPVFHEFGFDFLITLTAINERAMCSVMSINYDKSDSDETRRAFECKQRLVSTLDKVGYYSYRSSNEKGR